MSCIYIFAYDTDKFYRQNCSFFTNNLDFTLFYRNATSYSPSIHHYVMCVNTFTSICGIMALMNIAKQIGNNIKQARKYKGLTQRQVAAMLKMTQQQYSRFENGVFQLNYEQIVFLCNLYEITPNDIFEIY